MATANIRTSSASPQAMPGLESARPPASTESICDALRVAQGRQNNSVIRLTGGDLLLRSDLPELVAVAKSGDATRLWLMTTALPLLRAGIASRLRDMGVHGILVPLFGADADGHDWLVGRPGAQVATLRAIRTARSHGLDVDIVLPALRPTMRGLETLVARTLPLGVAAYHFVVPTPADMATASLSPSPALAAPWVLRAARLAAAGRRGVTYEGLVSCLLDDQATTDSRRRADHLELDATAAAARFAFENKQKHAEVCTMCRWQADCHGPWQAASARHGVMGILPRRDTPPRLSARAVLADPVI